MHRAVPWEDDNACALARRLAIGAQVETITGGEGEKGKGSSIAPTASPSARVAASVTRQKQHKLLRADALWLLARGGSFDTVNCRFDIIAITGCELEWLPDAFNADG